MAVLNNLTGFLQNSRRASVERLAQTKAINIEALHTAPTLTLPVVEVSDEEKTRSAFFEAGLYLARQDAWHTLAERIRAADAERSTTPAGIPEAELLAEGARADVVTAAMRAVKTGDEATCESILNDMAAILEEVPDHHGIAYVLAMAHVDIGWAWRGEGWRDDIPAANRAAFFRHFRKAADLIDAYDPFELNAPMLASVRCALLSSESRPRERASDDYEDLIDLAPGVGKYIKALGAHMLPRWFGSFERLDNEARRTMDRTFDVWGAGGYTWTYLDALTVDPEAFALLDATLFCEGIRDILERQNDQHTANMAAAYTGIAMDPNGINLAARSRISDCFGWIVEDHLREIHPHIWYAAKSVWACNMDEPSRLAKGRHRALDALDRHARGLPPITAPDMQPEQLG